MKTKFFLSVMLLVGLGDASVALANQDRVNAEPTAQTSADKPIVWKATLGTYKDSATRDTSTDVNVRGSVGDTRFWVGYYQETTDFKQSRFGIEQATGLASYGKLISSVQVASGGFVGGSLTWDGKQDNVDGWSPLLGWGRTNAKPYVNLNFDPNDSLLWGGSYSKRSWGQFSLFQIVDDRLQTGQRVTHAVWRGSLPNSVSLVVDAFHRSGASEAGEEKVSGNGLSTTVELRDYFVRVAYDQKANYTHANITRLAVGFRY